ncbi:protein O-GlcNAcase-like [Littorina saxatilis]|uniref:protein O-GlcNAcase n=1 Tax=Littorina saxatilis TaxID=31220 RepID=A0AAN9GK04_9CAEN
MTGADSTETRRKDDFTLGVVEGFYGLPWSAEQRKILFAWMQKMGLNTYMYAPKDDIKHRAHWRDLYSVEEADILTNLIESACEHEVTFVYAISPGLDISFSNPKDVVALKRKLEQVATFGCKAFALLFDDIDPELSEADRSAFASFAHAQVSVANEVYEHLGQPMKFLFCPTEYCTSRAVPNILSSGYLNILGSKLLPGIDVMWTGCKVISKKITIKTLEEISTVLKRPPVIWDNIHANDYDPRRVFLGPYDGRSPEIIPYIRGVMTNPNCEFEANFVACHTLGQWSKSNPDGVKKDIIASDRLSPIAADIKLETEVDTCSDEDLPSLGACYKSRQALKLAVKEWYNEFLKLRHPHRRVPPSTVQLSAPPGVPISQSHVPSPVPGAVPVVSMPIPDMMKTCTVTTPTVITSTMSIQGTPAGAPVPIVQPTPAPPEAIAACVTEIASNPNISLLQPLSEPVNALTEDFITTNDLDGLSDCGNDVEAMDCVPSPAVTTPASAAANQNNGSSESLMQVEGCDSSDKPDSSAAACAEFESCETDKVPQASPAPSNLENGPVSKEDVALLTEMFYLPFEHGGKALHFLHVLHWLIENLQAVQPAKKGSDEHKEWIVRAADFEKCVQDLDAMLCRLFYSPNKALLCCMHTYLWDLKSTLAVCLAFIKWLELGLVHDVSALPCTKMATWFSEGYKEAFTSGDMEPWAFRGGLQSELQRLLPIAAAHDLFFIKPPEIIVPVLPRFRPYQPEDEEAVYDICLKTCDDGMDGTDVFPENPKLIGDRLVGRFLSLSPEFCFVSEDQHGVSGYVLAASDARRFLAKTKEAWTPAMREKYPKPLHDDISPAEEVMLSFHNEPSQPGEDVYSRFPSLLRMDILATRLTDPAVPRRLLACVLCALKAAGSYGVHTELNTGDEFMTDVYTKLGFVNVGSESDKSSEDMIYMGRLF